MPFAKVSLPHQPFMEQASIVRQTLGKAIYRIKFPAPCEWKDKIVHLEIGAAMQKTAVYVNDRYLFTHFGGYQRFLVPLTDEIEFGIENTIRLETDNHPSDDMPPGKPLNTLDFCYYGGLYRNARLTVCERMHISDELEVSIPAGGGVFARTDSIDGGTAHLNATCHVLNDVPQSERWEFLGKSAGHGEVAVVMSLFSPDGLLLASKKSTVREIKPNCGETFAFALSIPDAPLWSPDHPQRCKIKFALFCDGRQIDEREILFGIRTIAFSGKDFFINGKKLFLLGTNRHMEYPFVGNSVPARAQERDAVLIKKGGNNFVRLCHYNQSPAFVDKCDELGILVMAPIPGWQYYKTNSAFICNLFRDCRELVRTLRNHPSVILWEVSLNEAYPPSWINDEMHRIAHEEYPSSQCYTAGDTVGNYEGWDVLFFHDNLSNRDKPVILREYGDWSFGGAQSTSRRGRKDGMKALVGQCWNFHWSLNRALSLGVFAGVNDWCFADYNRGCEPRIEESGSVDIFRVPKPKYFLYQSQNSESPVLAPFRDGEKVVVFSNCDEIAVFDDGREIARQLPDSGPDTPYNPDGENSPGWETAQLWAADTSGGNPYDGGNSSSLPHPPFTFKSLPAKNLQFAGFTGGIETIRADLAIPGEFTHVETAIRDEGIPPEEGDLLFAMARLADENGATVPLSRPVAFVAEDCEIVGAEKSTTMGIASALVKAGPGGSAKITCKVL